jgi:lactoylglutathione lyase
MRYLHTMVRVSDLEASLRFYCDGLGLKEIHRMDSEKGRFTLVFLATPEDIAAAGYTGGKIPEGLPCVELTWNWDPETYTGGRNFGHLAYRVENIYETCQRLRDAGHTIHRPPRDGHMAFVKSPDGISVELLQEGYLEPAEPWASMENVGSW